MGLRTLGAAVACVMWAAVSGTHAEPTMPLTAQGWSDAARSDINQAYAQFVANHPGVHDKANRGFPALLKKARQAGLALVPEVKSAEGYEAALNRFSTTLADGHAQAFPIIPDNETAAAQWPGFVAVWRADRLFVYDAEPDGPPKGASIVSCDGKPVRDLLRDTVFAYQGRIREAGQWWTQAGALFIDWGNPFVSRPSSCQFDEAGHLATRHLTWRATDAFFKSWRADSYNGDSLPIGISEPAPGLLWLALPTFEPEANGRDAYRDMEREINDHRDRFLTARAIVIDLRHNQGGSDEWGRGVGEALWGKARFDRRVAAYMANAHVLWRASKENAAYVSRLAGEMRSEKRDVADEFEAVAEGLKAAASRGKTWYAEPYGFRARSKTRVPSDSPGDPAPLATPVYVIVPGQCASACNDTLDGFTRFANTRLIGAPSSADSTYLEIRVEPLSSGMSKVVIPNKVWVGRPRAAGEFYRPSIVNASLTWSTQSFINLVEADLSDHR